MSVFGDTSERRLVSVVDYRLEPSCVLLGEKLRNALWDSMKRLSL